MHFIIVFLCTYFPYWNVVPSLHRYRFWGVGVESRPSAASSHAVVFVCRLHCPVAWQTPSCHHLINTLVHSVVGAFRECRTFVVTKPCTVAATLAGVRFVAKDVCLLITVDATWQYIRVSALGIKRYMSFTRLAWMIMIQDELYIHCTTIALWREL